jgi:hypothetical protein
MKNLLKVAALGLVIASTIVACNPKGKSTNQAIDSLSKDSIKKDTVIKKDSVSNKDLKKSNAIKQPIPDTVSN